MTYSIQQSGVVAICTFNVRAEFHVVGACHDQMLLVKKWTNGAVGFQACIGVFLPFSRCAFPRWLYFTLALSESFLTIQ